MAKILSIEINRVHAKRAHDIHWHCHELLKYSVSENAASIVLRVKIYQVQYLIANLVHS